MTQVREGQRSFNYSTGGHDRAADASPRSGQTERSQVTPPSPRPAQIMLMGVPMNGSTLRGLVPHLVTQSQQRLGGYLMTPNLDNMRTLTQDPAVLARAMAADIRVADGMPLIWASRLQGTPLPERVAGSDVIWELAGDSHERGRAYSCWGANPAPQNARRRP